MKNKCKTSLVSIVWVAISLYSETQCADDNAENKIQQTYNKYYQPKDLGSSYENINGDIGDLNSSLETIKTFFSLKESGKEVDSLIIEKIEICREKLENMDSNIYELQKIKIDIILAKISEFEKKIDFMRSILK